MHRSLPFHSMIVMRYKHILLIDDDIDDREIFMLAFQGVRSTIGCTILEDSQHALEQLRLGRITPDLIFLDLNMPKMNGHEFLKEMKANEELKKIPVIILSTSAHPHTIEETRRLGAHQFIKKPNQSDELTAILRLVLT